MKISELKIIIVFALFLLLILNFAEADMEGFVDTSKNVISNTGNFIGSVCDNGNWFFRPLIGSECTKDLQFLLMFILWGAFVFLFYDTIATYSAFSNLTSIAIGFGLAVILSNMGVIGWLAEIITASITTPAGIATLIGIAVVFLLFYIIAKTMMISEKKRKKEAEVEQSKKEVVEISKAINKGIGS
jgi:hypothetical protein